MTDAPTPRQHAVARLVEWITEIHTVWQLAIVLILGAAVLAATLLYQHPEWITMILTARLGVP